MSFKKTNSLICALKKALPVSSENPEIAINYLISRQGIGLSFHLALITSYINLLKQDFVTIKKNDVVNNDLRWDHLRLRTAALSGF